MYRAARIKATGEWLAVVQQTTDRAFPTPDTTWARSVLDGYPSLTVDDIEVVVNTTDPRVGTVVEPAPRTPEPDSPRRAALERAREALATATTLTALKTVVGEVINALEAPPIESGGTR